MHAENLSYPVEIGVQGTYISSCKLFKVVKLMHEVREGPIGITLSKMWNFLINRGQFLEEQHKEIGYWMLVKLAKY